MPILCLLGFGTASVFAFVIMFLRSKINKTHKCCPFSQYLPAIVIPYIMHGDAISEARCGSPLRQRSITVVVHTEIYVPRSVCFTSTMILKIPKTSNIMHHSELGVHLS